MTLSSALDRRFVRVGYIAGAGGLAAAALIPLQTDLVPEWVPLTLVLVYLGPLGVAALLVLVIPVSLVAVLPSSILLVLSVAIAVGVAIVNVRIVRRWSARPTGQTGTVNGTMRRRTWDQILGAVLFVLAGCAFMVLTFLAGFAALLAHGVDVRVPDAQANHIILVAAVTWWLGLALAITGLVLWIVRANQSRPLLPWAIADLVLILALIAVLILGTTSAAPM